jgi:hypothetical protein
MKRYELSIGKNYVSSWGISEAIRELVQNCIDSEINGNKFYYDLQGDTLTLGNKNTSLDVSTLVMGNTSKSNSDKYIGKYGEGFKLALLVLTRLGNSVIINNGNKEWIPSIEYSNEFQTDVLCINESDCINIGNNLEYSIDGIDKDCLESINEIILIFNKYNFINTNYGQILTDKQYRGKMYVNGLYVMTDSDFDYGYNFEAQYVKLDRDRKYISWSDLREMAAKSILSADVSVLMDIVDSRGVDKDKIENYIDTIDESYRKEYKKQYYEKYDLNPEVRLITEGQAKKDGIQESEKFHITRALNIKLMDEPKYVDELNEFNDTKQSYDYYEQSDYKELLEWFVGVINKLNFNEINDFFNKIESLEPSYFDRIKEKVFEELNISQYS